MKNKSAVVYSKANCPDCSKAKGFLNSREIPFVEIMIVPDAEANGNDKISRETLLTIIPNAKSVPQILIGGYILAGSKELNLYFLEK